MGKKDTITKSYMANPRRFADAFNYYLFEGEQVIKADNLEPLDPTEVNIFVDENAVAIQATAPHVFVDFAYLNSR